MSRHVKAVTIAPIRYVGRRLGQLVVRFRHLAPIAACPRPNVGIARTTRNDKFRVAFLNVAFVRRDCRIGDTNVKFTPLIRAAHNRRSVQNVFPPRHDSGGDGF